jgi:hypothetical protein
MDYPLSRLAKAMSENWGRVNNAVGSAISREPGYIYGDVVPYRTKAGPEGGIEWAVPEMLASPMRGIAALGKGQGVVGPPENRHLNPDTLNAFTGLPMGGMLAAPAGAVGMFGGRLGQAAERLPMDEASRIARAREMGFDTPAFHGTAETIASFNPDRRGDLTKAESARIAHWFVDDPKTASGYAELAAGFPVQRLIEQSQAAERAGKWDLAHDLMAQAENLEQGGGAGGQNVLPSILRGKFKEFDADGAMMADLSESQLADWTKQARREGFDGVKIANLSDEAGWGQHNPATHYGVFDPKNIRSRFAAFDPAKKDSADLLASRPLGYPLAWQQQEGAPDPRRDLARTMSAILSGKEFL